MSKICPSCRQTGKPKGNAEQLIFYKCENLACRVVLFRSSRKNE
jgi:predicted  nucleic acid-binding Zn ribbon protein